MSDAVRELKDKAAQLALKGKLPAALEAWQKVTAAAPDDAAAWQKVAELQGKLGKKAEAVQAYEEAARRLAQQGQFFKASAVCRVLLGLEPGHQRTQALIASLYAQQKPPQRTAKQLTAAEPAPPPAPPPAEAAPPAGAPVIPLFGTLGQEELREVLSNAMEVRSYPAGAAIVSEGAPGDSMFALVEGSADVYRGWGTPAQRKVAHVAAGEVFGEAAMVSGAPRLATVVAETDAQALEISRDAMGKIIAAHPHVGQMVDQFYRERLLANVLRASPIIRELPEPEKKALAAAFQPTTFVDGQRIISEGQPADSVHLLLRGVCAATHESGARYPDLREGDLFGELSAMSGGAATASVTAQGPVLTLRLAAVEFKARIMKAPAAMLAVTKLAQVRVQRTAQFDKDAEAAGIDVEIVEDARV